MTAHCRNTNMHMRAFHEQFGGHAIIVGIPAHNRTKRVGESTLVTVLLKRIAGAFLAFIHTRDALGAMILAFGTV